MTEAIKFIVEYDENEIRVWDLLWALIKDSGDDLEFDFRANSPNGPITSPLTVLLLQGDVETALQYLQDIDGVEWANLKMPVPHKIVIDVVWYNNMMTKEGAAVVENSRPQLEPHEIELLEMVRDGVTAGKQIALALHKTHQTVKNQFSDIYKKLGITSDDKSSKKIRALLWAIEEGLVKGFENEKPPVAAIEVERRTINIEETPLYLRGKDLLAGKPTNKQ